MPPQPTLHPERQGTHRNNHIPIDCVRKKKMGGGAPPFVRGAQAASGIPVQLLYSWEALQLNFWLKSHIKHARLFIKLRWLNKN
jgi:hypothetical protein